MDSPVIGKTGPFTKLQQYNLDGLFKQCNYVFIFFLQCIVLSAGFVYLQSFHILGWVCSDKPCDGYGNTKKGKKSYVGGYEFKQLSHLKHFFFCFFVLISFLQCLGSKLDYQPK